MDTEQKVAGKNPQRTAALAAFIVARLKELNLSASGAGLAAGLDRTAVRDIYRGSAPGTQKLAALARVLRVAPAQLLRLVDTSPQPAARHEVTSPSRRSVLDANDSLRFDAGPHDLPLVRQEASQVDGTQSDVLVARIARPASLAERPLAYAVYASDDLNAPLIVAGHVAYVDPSRPVQMDRPARVFPRDGAPFLAILRRQDADQVVVQVLAESEPRVYPAAEISRLERVVAFSVLDE